MKRLIVFAVIGSLLTPTIAAAGDRHGRYDRYRGPPAYHSGYYGHQAGYAYAPYHYNHHKNGNDSDDAAWAIGGLVLGAIIGASAAKADRAADMQEVAPASTPLPPPQKRKVVTCYDEVAYDEAGEPYVARQCYENWR